MVDQIWSKRRFDGWSCPYPCIKLLDIVIKENERRLKFPSKNDDSTHHTARRRCLQLIFANIIISWGRNWNVPHWAELLNWTLSHLKRISLQKYVFNVKRNIRHPSRFSKENWKKMCFCCGVFALEPPPPWPEEKSTSDGSNRDEGSHSSSHLLIVKDKLEGMDASLRKRASLWEPTLQTWITQKWPNIFMIH